MIFFFAFFGDFFCFCTIVGVHLKLYKTGWLNFWWVVKTFCILFKLFMGYINFSYFSLDRTYFLFNMLLMEVLLNENIFKTKKFILYEILV